MSRVKNNWQIKLISISLSIVGISSALIFSEFIVRKVRPQKLIRAYVKYDAELGDIIRPNFKYLDVHAMPDYSFHVRTNSVGMRMVEEVDTSDYKKKIIVLGDSFTLGWGVDIEDSFFNIMRSRIENIFNQVQLLNAGHGGNSTGHVLKNLKRHSKVILISGMIYFMNNNDLLDNIYTNINYRVVTYREFEDGSIKLEDVPAFSPIKRFLLTNTPYGWLNQHSHFFILTKKMVKLVIGKHDPVSIKRDDVMSAFDRNQLQTMYAVSWAHLRRLINYCKDRDLPLLIVWIPHMSEMLKYYGRETRLSSIFNSFKEGIISDQNMLSEEVKFFDPTDRMALLIPDKQVASLYYNDGHYNKKGNRLYANAVTENISEFIKHLLASNQ